MPTFCVGGCMAADLGHGGSSARLPGIAGPDACPERGKRAFRHPARGHVLFVTAMTHVRAPVSGGGCASWCQPGVPTATNRNHRVNRALRSCAASHTARSPMAGRTVVRPNRVRGLSRGALHDQRRAAATGSNGVLGTGAHTAHLAGTHRLLDAVHGQLQPAVEGDEHFLDAAGTSRPGSSSHVHRRPSAATVNPNCSASGRPASFHQHHAAPTSSHRRRPDWCTVVTSRPSRYGAAAHDRSDRLYSHTLHSSPRVSVAMEHPGTHRTATHARGDGPGHGPRQSTCPSPPLITYFLGATSCRSFRWLPSPSGTRPLGDGGAGPGFHGRLGRLSPPSSPSARTTGSPVWPPAFRTAPPVRRGPCPPPRRRPTAPAVRQRPAAVALAGFLMTVASRTSWSRITSAPWCRPGSVALA